MGGTSWSDSHYQQRAAARASTNTPVFAYDQQVRAVPVDQRTVHDKLNPKGVKIRESRDSDAHPQARAVSVLFDITGSMLEVPIILQQNLPKLMGLLIRKGYLEHPAIMVGGIGDAYTDQAKLQVGQFESGIEIEEDLSKLWLEGNGGGQVHESYGLAMYFLARHTALDCWEKRQQKGYCFIIGDEMPYDTVPRNQVADVIGDTLEADLSLRDVLTELQQTFEVYFVLPRMTSYFDHHEVNNTWKELLNEQFLKLDDPAAICELIASTIGLREGIVGLDGLEDDLVAAGSTANAASSVSRALALVGANAPRGSAIAVPHSGADTGITNI